MNQSSCNNDVHVYWSKLNRFVVDICLSSSFLRDINHCEPEKHHSFENDVKRNDPKILLGLKMFDALCCRFTNDVVFSMRFYHINRYFIYVSYGIFRCSYDFTSSWVFFGFFFFFLGFPELDDFYDLPSSLYLNYESSSSFSVFSVTLGIGGCLEDSSWRGYYEDVIHKPFVWEC